MTTTGWVVAVADTYQHARQAAEALKVTWDHGPNAKVSSESLLAEAKRLQKLDDSGLFFVKTGDTASGLASAAKVLEDSKALANVPAVAKGQIIYMAPDTYLNEGIQTYTEFLNDFADALEAAQK